MEEEVAKKREAQHKFEVNEIRAIEQRQAIEEQRYLQQLEQERHDRELAIRLAMESNGQVEDSPPTTRRYILLVCLKTVDFCCLSLLLRNIVSFHVFYSQTILSFDHFVRFFVLYIYYTLSVNNIGVV